MKKLLLVLAVVFAVALFAGACGGDDDDDSSSSGTTEASSDDDEADDEGSGGDADAGEVVFAETCASCHGDDAEGIDGLGKPLADSDYVAETSEADLIVVVTDGRAVDDPDNTTGILMPPKGGNPALTDEDVENVVVYIKSLN